MVSAASRPVIAPASPVPCSPVVVPSTQSPKTIVSTEPEMPWPKAGPLWMKS